MACGSCAQRRANAANRRPTLMRVETTFFEVVGGDGRRTGRYDTLDEARANQGGGQVRRRVDSVDVLAAYSVRIDDVEVARFPRAADAAAALRDYPDDAAVFMVPQ